MSKKKKPWVTEEALCCCEYYNEKGETSHVAACCCDCEPLDDACDKCFKCERMRSAQFHKLLMTIEDRCRLPWCSGRGAVRLKLDVVVPFFTISSCLLFATLHVYCTMIGLISLPSVILIFNWMYRQGSKQKRSRVFYSWGVFSSVWAYAVFQFIVISFREILLWENILLATLFVLMFYFMYQTKMNTGELKKHYSDGKTVKDNFNNSDSAKFSGNNSTSDNFSMNGHHPGPVNFLANKDCGWYEKCGTMHAHRAGHCSVCNICVHMRDHHCVWIDCCVGGDNHRAFLCSLLLFVVTGFYGAHLTLTTLCTPEIYFNWILVPRDCSYMHADFFVAVCFVTAVYTTLACTAMSSILLYQIILISQNITSQEAHRMRQRGNMIFGLFARSNCNSKGVLQNWTDFLAGERESIKAHTHRRVLPL